MKKVFEIIKNNSLFTGINLSDFDKMFGCLSANIKNYNKGDIILLSGDSINFIGVILSGTIKIIK